MLVLCLISLQLTQIHYVSIQASGKLIRDQEERWYVDFTDYINRNSQYKEWNYPVMVVNSNDCLYK